MTPERARDRKGRTYRLGEVVGRGGEAVVYQVRGKNDLLAKIYSRPNRQRESKLSWMIANPPDDPAARLGHTSISWPVEILHQNRRFCGYLMPSIRDAVQLLSVFHPRLRLLTFSQFTNLHLHNTAYNIAAALGAIHDRSYVVGDLNESNILVARSTLVTLIDTDSFQVQVTGPLGRTRVHYCEVGKPEYLPPELQGANLKDTVRTPEQDRFSLAVLIFQLLMNGSHPFRARWVAGGEKPSLPERIENGLFPYREGVADLVRPAVDLEGIHPPLIDLFKRCFILGHDTPSARPAPGEWERALAQAAGSLVGCKNGHFHSPQAKNCPECRRPPVMMHRPVHISVEKRRTTPSTVQISGGTARRSWLRSLRPPTINLNWPAITKFITVRTAGVKPWLRSDPVRHFLLLPAFWTLTGSVIGGLLSLQVAPHAAARALGILGGLLAGALAGELIEKRVGWEVFLGVAGAAAGAWGWYHMRPTGGLTGWILAAGGGGLTGSILGRYGRSVQLTVLWAAMGASAGWLLGGGVAAWVSPVWLAGAAGAGTISLMAGLTYSLWKKYS